jgi:hypothetical protein
MMMIIEPPIYREVLTYYKEKIDGTAEILKGWDKINWDEMKSINTGLNVSYLEKLERDILALERIDHEISICVEKILCTMRITYLPVELRSHLAKYVADRRLKENKKITRAKIFGIFEHKHLIIIKKLTSYLEKTTNQRKKQSTQTILRAFKNYQKRIKLQKTTEIFRKYFQQVKEKREKANSLLKKYVKR